MGRGRGEMREKVQGIGSINCRYKIDRGRLRIVWDIINKRKKETKYNQRH